MEHTKSKKLNTKSKAHKYAPLRTLSAIASPKAHRKIKNALGPQGVLASLDLHGSTYQAFQPTQRASRSPDESLENNAQPRKMVFDCKWSAVKFHKLPQVECSDISQLDENAHCHAKAAFAVKEIVEGIFSRLDHRTLFNCRLVCRSWAALVALELQKTVTLTCTKHRGILSKNPPRSLDTMMAVMRNSAMFPCTSFKFFDTDHLMDPLPTAFFNSCGHLIKKLELVCKQYEACNCYCNCLCNPPTLCSVRLEAIRKLVWGQLPNLEHLVINGSIEVICNNGRKEQFKTKRIKLNLRTIEFSETFPETFLQEIVDASPHLTEASVPYENLHSFIRPVNRIHLLRTLKASINDGTIDLLETISGQGQGQGQSEGQLLSLKELDLYTDVIDAECELDLFLRAREVLLKILQDSSESIEKLTWHQQLFADGLKIPKMSKVTELTLTFYPKETTGYYGYFDEVYRFGSCLRDVFPNLELVRIKLEHGYGLENFCNLEECGFHMNRLFEILKPVESVTVVCCQWLKRWSTENVHETLKALFPNARIHPWVPNKLFL